MGKLVVRVSFMDEAKRAFALESDANAADLFNVVCDKLELRESGCFAIFEQREDWERCLDDDEKPADIQKQWEQAEPSKSKKKDEPMREPRFMFKKKIFLKDDEKELDDTVAKDLVYKQAVYNITASVYPTQLDDALRFSGLQMQVVYGDHNSSTHVPGFLTANLQKFVPDALWGTKKPNDWESSILKEHQAHRGKSQEEAKSEYISMAKLLPYYGTTFFPWCRSVNKGLPAKVIIGVNYEGIRLLKVKNKELVSEHLFTEICSWASSSGTFAFEFGNQSESTKYTFETKQGAIIASTIQTYIDILVQMLKNGDEDESLTSDESDED